MSSRVCKCLAFLLNILWKFIFLLSRRGITLSIPTPNGKTSLRTESTLWAAVEGCCARHYSWSGGSSVLVPRTVHRCRGSTEPPLNRMELSVSIVSTTSPFPPRKHEAGFPWGRCLVSSRSISSRVPPFPRILPTSYRIS